MKESETGMYAQLAKIMARKSQKNFRGVAIVRGLRGMGGEVKTAEQLAQEFGISASKVKAINNKVCDEMREELDEVMRKSKPSLTAFGVEIDNEN